jgi:hypothetical protein
MVVHVVLRRERSYVGPFIFASIGQWALVMGHTTFRPWDAMNLFPLLLEGAPVPAAFDPSFCAVPCGGSKQAGGQDVSDREWPIDCRRKSGRSQAILSRRTEAEWVVEVDRISTREPIKIQPPRQPNRIYLRELIQSDTYASPREAPPRLWDPNI